MSGWDVIIAGSRGITDMALVESAIRESRFSVGKVISGCAKGVDMLGIDWAEARGIPVDRHPADWRRFGRAAGFRRNEEMALIADALIAVWDGKSNGTRHMIEIAREHKLPVFVATPSKGDVK